MKLALRSLAAIVALTSIGCGGSESPEPASQQAEPAPPGVSGQAPEATQGIPSVVTLAPAGGAPTAAPSEPALMDQLSLSFMPNALMVQAGQTVQFKNSETLAHNVHLTYVDNDSTLLTADMDPGASTHIVLDHEGGYDVTCDEHPGMRAFIYVTSAPYSAFAAVDGSFQILDVPNGIYTATVWSATDSLRSQRDVQISAPSTTLDLTRP